MIPRGVYVRESMRLRISLRRVSMKEVISRSLDVVVIEANNQLRKR